MDLTWNTMVLLGIFVALVIVFVIIDQLHKSWAWKRSLEEVRLYRLRQQEQRERAKQRWLDARKKNREC